MSQSQSHPGLSVLTLMGQGQNQDPDTQKCVLILLFGDTPISVIFNQLYGSSQGDQKDGEGLGLDCGSAEPF